MKCQIPQISWHERTPVLSVDFQVIGVDKELRRLATGGTDSHVVIWHVNLCSKNTVNVECACELSRHNKSVNVVRFSPSGEYLASGDDEGAIFIWKLREKNVPDLDDDENNCNKENWHPLKLLRGHLDDICDLNWSPNSDFLISGSIDNSAIVWDIQKGQSIKTLKDAKSFVQGVAWDPLNQYQAVISSDRMLRIYSASTGRVLHKVHKSPWTETINKVPGKCNKLFHDDTLQSFCRRLSFSPDGELLFVPSGIKEKDDTLIHTTYVFSRYEFARPILHLPTGQKYTLAVRCCPIYFKLKGTETMKTKGIINLPYRILIAVATQDTIFFYDTQQLLPFGYVSNIHYTHLTDISWSSDGLVLIISSTDGYCSFIIFNEGELGEVYVPEIKPAVPIISIDTSSVVVREKDSNIMQFENVLTDSGNIGKETVIAKDCAVSPNANKLKDTKIPASNKKVYTIKNFFSPPRKKMKTDDAEECVVIKEIKHTEKTKPVSKIISSDVEMVDTLVLDDLQKKDDPVNMDVSEKTDNIVNMEVSEKTDKAESNNMKITDLFKKKNSLNSLTQKNYDDSLKKQVSTDNNANVEIINLETDYQKVVDLSKNTISEQSNTLNFKPEIKTPMSGEIKPKKRIAFTTLSTKATFKKD